MIGAPKSKKLIDGIFHSRVTMRFQDALSYSSWKYSLLKGLNL